jgi:hypothetical protein
VQKAAHDGDSWLVLGISISVRDEVGHRVRSCSYFRLTDRGFSCKARFVRVQAVRHSTSVAKLHRGPCRLQPLVSQPSPVHS